MTRAELLAELKTVLRETTYDAAWGDNLLLSYLAEGQDKFCEDTGFFVDRTNYTVTTVIGTANYAINERIIKVLEVWYGNTRLGKFQQSDLGVDYPPQLSLNLPTEVSDSYAWQADAQTGILTLYPTPTSVRTLNLRVWRYPRYALNTSNIIPPAVVAIDAEPEIPARFHRAMIHWAAFRALTHHDFEQQDKIKAADHRQIYEDIKNEGRTAFERTMARNVELTPNTLYVV